LRTHQAYINEENSHKSILLKTYEKYYDVKAIIALIRATKTIKKAIKR